MRMALTAKLFTCFSCLLAITGLALAAASCGDDAAPATRDGCTSDKACKGDRICVDRECVDPETAADRDGGGDPSSAGEGAGRGASGAGGSDAGSNPGGRDAGTDPGSAGRTVIDDPDLERACILNCEARDAANC